MRCAESSGSASGGLFVGELDFRVAELEDVSALQRHTVQIHVVDLCPIGAAEVEEQAAPGQ